MQLTALEADILAFYLFIYTHTHIYSIYTQKHIQYICIYIFIYRRPASFQIDMEQDIEALFPWSESKTVKINHVLKMSTLPFF
jgi:hypothetical protein